MVRHLLIIGEAVVRLGREFHSKHPAVPWAQIVGMRNILVHEYFGVDYEEIWTAVNRDVPNLKREVEGLLRELGEGD